MRSPLRAMRSERARLRLAAGLLAALLAGATGAPAAAGMQADRRAAYEAVGPKSILDLQPFRSESEARLAEGTALRLVSINPAVNGWFLLVLGEGAAARSFHLENPDPRQRSVTLQPGPAATLVLEGPGGRTTCEPWAGTPSDLDRAVASGLPFAPLCGDRLLLRNRVSGSATSLERTTDFLRDHVWGGESVVGFVRDTFFRDSHAEESPEVGTASGHSAAGPRPAPLKAPDDARPVLSVVHDLGLAGGQGARMAEGTWYPVAGLDGVFASAIRPAAISDAVLRGPGKANALDPIEGDATAILVAFDLARFDLGFAMGTDHPRLDWSPRAPASVRAGGLPGPDGVGSPEPLVMLGMVSPALTDRTVATFTGGFKRQHGAFKWGPLSTVNSGSHYGFVEQGTVLGKLQPGLATVYALADGTIGMTTWTGADDALLPRIRFARQNGVALVEPDPATGEPLPGRFVTQWGPGNWSGSAAAELRTLRAGACMAAARGGRYLVYGYFSTATPSAMARTFQAYGCEYAMLLDMNALEHTYLALYVRRAGQVHVEHIVPGMGLVDRKDKRGNVIPRFLGYPDNRDLFYLTRKE
ncbi:hypothetical protein M1105_17070 [Limibaculum sp. FT325]|uniref:hypothetical protein n=1 Tax=Thermohalobaculum sediminis TaxID=2939436 RepID=UPI0020BDFA9E|nr:hypothetical protein [Limibaculum sediminis]MCL5778692.1 hypothetical protein [Limibaculum sediminis]